MANEKKGNSTFIIDDTLKFRLPVGTVFFHDLFTPRSFKDDDKPKYSVTFGYKEDADFSEYKQALKVLQSDPRWPKNVVFRGSPEEQKAIDNGIGIDELITAIKPIKKETKPETLEKYPHYKGMFIGKASCAATFPPLVIGPDRKRITEKEEVYRGCEGIALVSIGLNTTTGRVSLRLKGFQKVKEGEPIGSMSATPDMFETFQDSSVDTTGFEEV